MAPRIAGGAGELRGHRGWHPVSTPDVVGVDDDSSVRRPACQIVLMFKLWSRHPDDAFSKRDNAFSTSSLAMHCALRRLDACLREDVRLT
jgi:hypothetical protein